jgi:Leucine rich repeat
MGGSVSMPKKTYTIGRSNRNAPNLYRAYNCYDHLFPFEIRKIARKFPDIRLSIALDAFNCLVTHKLNIKPHSKMLSREEIDIYKNIVSPDKILQRQLLSSHESREIRIELSPDEKQVYLCRNYLVELSENIVKLKAVTVFQTCCNYLRYLPYGIGQLRNLKMLILSRNRLVELPDEIGLCKELREIDVSYNMLRTLPRSIVGLKKLNTLQLAGNLFNELPNFIGKLNSLKYLHVGQNSIASIPLEVFKLPFLLSLTTDNCKFSKNKIFAEVGNISLKEIVARTIIRNNTPIRKNLPAVSRNYLLKVQECSFCGGPFFDSYIAVEDFQVFESEIYPVHYRMCCRHYHRHEERLQTLFEKSLSSYPMRLMQDNMPTVCELFEPYCFNEYQVSKLTDAIKSTKESVPLIFLAKYNFSFFKRFGIDKLLDENLEKLNLFDDKPQECVNL